MTDEAPGAASPSKTGGARKWVGSMQWHDLLFMHWPVAPEVLRSFVPPALAIDTFDGAAWIGLVPFVMQGVRPRLLPSVPGLSQFPELNVRTYVHPRGEGERTDPGVWFFSLDAHQPVAVRLARWGFDLPYFDADMAARTDDRGRVLYASRRTHADAPDAVFRARYGPTGPARRAEQGGLTHWLTERYYLYAARAAGAAPFDYTGTPSFGPVYRGRIHHEPWPLQPAEATVETNTLVDGLGFALPDRAPHLRFARRLDVRAWWPRRLG